MERGINNNGSFRREELLALLSIKGVGNQTVSRVIKQYRDFHELMNLGAHKFKEVSHLRDADISYNLLYNNCQSYINEALEKIEKYEQRDIKVIDITSKLYPQKYRELKDAPLFIYCRGNTDLLNWSHSVAIIGTRECSEIGFSIGKKTATYFASKQFNIVSGLAIGIDTSAHIGALKANGLTTAILVDVDKIYPKENSKLAHEILENNGLLLSENAPGAFVNKNMFVLRDRLQSALSDAVFPIETDIKGGTMHTVGYSREYKIPLYCPNLFDIKGYDTGFSKAQGILKLIREGIAQPYTASSYEQIYQKLAGKDGSALTINAPLSNEIETDFSVNTDAVSEYLFDVAQYTNKKTPKAEKPKSPRKPRVKKDSKDNTPPKSLKDPLIQFQ